MGRRAFLLVLAIAIVAPRGAGAATVLTRVGGPGVSQGSPAPWTTDRLAAFYTQSITGEVFSSAAVGDVTGNGSQTVVAGFPDGTVYGWRVPDGTRVFKFSTGPGAVQSSPTLVDLDGNGVLDVLAANTAGDVVGFNAAGKTLFRAHDICTRGCGVFGTPTVADIDRDGRREVVLGSWDHNVHAWHIDDGSEVRGFPVFVHDTIWSSPSIADLDGDGFLEIVVGIDCDGVNGQPCYPKRGGYVLVLRHDGSTQPGWPRFVEHQVVWSVPAIVDLNGDGALDIVVGTGTNMPPPAGNIVLALDRNGRDLPGWPVTTGGRMMGSPAIGDINGDGRLDVVVPSEDGRINAWDRAGTVLPGWPRCNANDINGCPVNVHGSVALADVAGTGRPQVIHGGEQWLRVFDGNGTLLAQMETIAGTTPLTAAPTVANVGGEAWVFQTATYFASGGGFPDLGGVWAWRAGRALGPAPWPTFKQNMARTGTPVPLPTGVLPRPSTPGRPATTRAPRPAPSAATVAPTTTTTAADVVAIPLTTPTTEARRRQVAAPATSDEDGFPLGAGLLGIAAFAWSGTLALRAVRRGWPSVGGQ